MRRRRQESNALDLAVVDIEGAGQDTYSTVIEFANSLALSGEDRLQIDELYQAARSQLQSCARTLEAFGNASPSPQSQQSRFAAIIGRQVVALDAMTGVVALIGFADEADKRDLMSILERGQAVVVSSDAVIEAMRRSDEEAISAIARMKQAGLDGFEIDANELVVELGRLKANQSPLDPGG